MSLIQTITIQLKLYPTTETCTLLNAASLAYIQMVNTLVSEMVEATTLTNKTTKDIIAPLNSAVKNQAIRDAKSVFQKARKTKFQIIPILKKPVIFWNNQNYTIGSDSISMPFIVNGKSKRLMIKADIYPYAHDLLQRASKLGSLRVTCKNGTWMAQIAMELSIEQHISKKVMGVDLGIKVPAVCMTEDQKVSFVGNGRKNKYMRRKYNSRRKKLGKAKKVNAIKKTNDKEQRYMKDQDHKISHDIIAFAVKHDIGIIRLEHLTGIRQTTRKSRKNNRTLSNWSFYRLAMYIAYKAKLAGIKVEYVKPEYTSQRCPKYGEIHHASDRSYYCSDCGFSGHRDLVGAWNIIFAPVLDGNSQAA